MRRKHLFEFGDLPWFPGFMRAGLQSLLRTAYDLQKLPGFWVELLARALKAQGTRKLHDVAAGAGGPMFLLVRALERDKNLRPVLSLSDLYPNLETVRRVAALNDPRFTYLETPLDAAAVPRELDGVRVLVGSFHHMPPGTARAILGDAFVKRKAVCVFEMTRNSPVALLTVVLIPFITLAITPFIRKVSLLQLLFTYLVPVLPLVVMWDGFVSHLRTYSPAELRELVRDFQAPGYTWEIGEQRCFGFAFPLPYLVGLPEQGKDPGEKHADRKF